MLKIIQHLEKQIKPEDLDIITQNLLKYGWSGEQVKDLVNKKFTERRGVLTDGAWIVETIEIKPEFEIIKGI